MHSEKRSPPTTTLAAAGSSNPSPARIAGAVSHHHMNTKDAKNIQIVSELFSYGNFPKHFQRYTQSAKLQQALDRLLPQMGLPHITVTPAGNHMERSRCEFLLNVQSAALAMQLRSHIPMLQTRLRPYLGKDFHQLVLRVRNRPSIAEMQRREAPKLVMPPSVKRQLTKTASALRNPRLQSAVHRLLKNQDTPSSSQLTP